ncbi:MAG: hypothetical protein F6J96_33615 [Symploca sp. SIO1C2]|nr:hypothetical protein [Symploca sp. SIO1C2]
MRNKCKEIVLMGSISLHHLWKISNTYYLFPSPTTCHLPPISTENYDLFSKPYVYRIGYNLEIQRKLADLEMLELAAAAGEIDLFYEDESGLSRLMSVSYSYYFQREQKSRVMGDVCRCRYKRELMFF